jgi:hypothetical protein
VLFLNTLQAPFLEDPSKHPICMLSMHEIYTLQATNLMHAVRCNLLPNFNVVLNHPDSCIAFQQHGKCYNSDSAQRLSERVATRGHKHGLVIALGASSLTTRCACVQTENYEHYTHSVSWNRVQAYPTTRSPECTTVELTVTTMSDSAVTRRCRWEDNIKMGLHLIQDRDQWRAVVNTVPLKAENFLSE